MYKYIFIILLFASCMTPKKAVDFLKKKELLADTCAANFPVIDSVLVRDTTIIDTVTIQSEVVLTDTVYVKGDTVIRIKKCPPNTVITKILRHDSIIIRRDRAYETKLGENVRTLQDQAIKDKTLLDLTKASRNKWRLWFFILAGLVAAYVGLKLFSPFKI